MPHTVQAAPLTPQAPAMVPVWQLPPWQQPPLQTVWLPPPQELEQVWVAVLQVCPVGQSVATLQPQAMPERHTWPLALLEQSTQAPPLEPQLPLPRPPLQVPPLQQPPLQSWPALQLE